MSRTDVDALVQIFSADNGQHNSLAPVGLVHLVPRLELHATDIGTEAGGLRQCNGTVHTLPLGLASVQKLLVSGTVSLYGLQLTGL